MGIEIAALVVLTLSALLCDDPVAAQRRAGVVVSAMTLVAAQRRAGVVGALTQIAESQEEIHRRN